jgi:mannan endo-1,4-beta-mannosidase
MSTQQPDPSRSFPPRSSRVRAVIIGVCVVALVAVVATSLVGKAGQPNPPGSSGLSGDPAIGTFSRDHVVIHLPAHAASYLGAFAKGVPGSYAPMKSFAAATGAHPNLALYYSGWYEKFQLSFATEAKDNGAVPFIQIDPAGIQFSAIVGGVYDKYLETIATDIAAFGARTGQGVIIGFGHEMNGYWFPWGNGHVSPALFVAAWRHVVDVFREQGADDVTWLWTVNIIDDTKRGRIPSPAPWWPGSSYVTWVGIDGYYLKPGWQFAPLFGPTIKAVRSITFDPILISETGASPAAGQPSKITNLFTGVRNYGLLGFVWFDAKGTQDWRLRAPAALAAFRQGAATFDETSP